MGASLKARWDRKKKKKHCFMIKIFHFFFYLTILKGFLIFLKRKEKNENLKFTFTI